MAVVTPCCVHCRLTKTDAWTAAGRNKRAKKHAAHWEIMDECAKDQLAQKVGVLLRNDAKDGLGLSGQELADRVSRTGLVYENALATTRELFFTQSARCALYGIPLRWGRGWNQWSLDRGDNKRLHFNEDGSVQDHCRFVCRLFNISGSDTFRPRETMLEILSSVPSDFRPDVFTDATREAARIALQSPQLHSPFFLGH